MHLKVQNYQKQIILILIDNRFAVLEKSEKKQKRDACETNKHYYLRILKKRDLNQILTMLKAFLQQAIIFTKLITIHNKHCSD